MKHLESLAVMCLMSMFVYVYCPENVGSRSELCLLALVSEPEPCDGFTRPGVPIRGLGVRERVDQAAVPIVIWTR